MHLSDDGFDRPRTNAVLAVRHSVFKNVNRLLEPGKVLHGLSQALRVNFAIGHFNAGIALGLVRRNGDLYEESLGTSEFKANAQSAVIIDPYKIASVFNFGQCLAEFVQRKRGSPALDALGKIVIEAPLNKSTQPAIHG